MISALPLHIAIERVVDRYGENVTFVALDGIRATFQHSGPRHSAPELRRRLDELQSHHVEIVQAMRRAHVSGMGEEGDVQLHKAATVLVRLRSVLAVYRQTIKAIEEAA